MIEYYQVKVAKILDQYTRFYWGVSVVLYSFAGLAFWNMEWIYEKNEGSNFSIRIMYMMLVCVTIVKMFAMFISSSVVGSMNLENKLSSMLCTIYSRAIYLFIIVCFCLSFPVDLMRGYERIYWVLVILTSIIAFSSMIWFFVGNFPEKEKRKRFDKDVLDSDFHKKD